MRMISVCFITTLLLIPIYSDPNLSKDARLKSRLNLTLKMVTLNKFLQEVSQQTKVPLSASQEIANDKVTVLTKAKPIWEVLTKLSRLLDLRWDKNSVGYRLLPSDKTQKLENQLLTAKQRFRRQQIRQNLQRWMQSNQEEISLNSLPKYLAGIVMGQFTEDMWQRFWSGEVLLFSTKPNSTQISLPKQTLQYFVSASPPLQDSSVDGLTLLIHWQEQKGEVVLLLVPHIRFEQESYLPTVTALSATISLDRSVLPHRYVSRWSNWQTPLESLEREPILQKPLKHRSDNQASQSEFFGMVHTVSDHLEWLSNHSDLSVISDAFRYPSQMPNSDNGAITPYQWLEEFAKFSDGYFRLEGDYLLFRHANYWDLRTSEIPESILLPLEQKAQKEGGLTLEDYAQLASCLMPSQQARFEGYLSYPLYVLRFDPTPLRTSIPALRFWASLTEEQKQRARERHAIQLSQFGPYDEPFLLFWDGIYRGLLNPWIPSGNLVEKFEELSHPDAVGDLSFFLDDWVKNKYQLTTDKITVTADSLEDLKPLLTQTGQNQLVSVNQISVHTYTFQFGFDSQHAVSFTITLEQKLTVIHSNVKTSPN